MYYNYEISRAAVKASRLVEAFGEARQIIAGIFCCVNLVVGI
jgi:hypothetical protein